MYRNSRLLAYPLLVAAALAAPAFARAGVDTVLSGEIKEADGTSGQDTNAGSGVKTGHLQDAAVTSAKLAPAAVGTAAIADGAVTPAKLAGAIPASLIDRTGLDADSIDGYQAGDFSPIGHDHVLSEIQASGTLARRTRNVLVVAKDGSGDFTNPDEAIRSIADASPENPYLVKIMPGVYDVAGFGTHQNIDVEGSGEGVTKVRVEDWNTSQFHTQLYGPGEVRNLTIEMTNSKGAVALGMRLSHVTLVRRATLNGVFWAVLSIYRDSVLDHVTLRATSDEGVDAGYGYGLYSIAGVVVRDSDISVSGSSSISGFQTGTGSSPTWSEFDRTRIAVSSTGSATGAAFRGASRVSNTRIVAETTGPYAFGVTASGEGNELGHSEIAARAPASATTVLGVNNTGTTSFAYSKVEGRFIGSGVSRCIGVYDASYAPVTCP